MNEDCNTNPEDMELDSLHVFSDGSAVEIFCEQVPCDCPGEECLETCSTRKWNEMRVFFDGSDWRNLERLETNESLTILSKVNDLFCKVYEAGNEDPHSLRVSPLSEEYLTPRLGSDYDRLLEEAYMTLKSIMQEWLEL